MIKNFFRHLHTVNKHRFLVFIHCCKCGIVWRGLVHDLSKYSPTEFFEGVKYYQGSRSPITACREDNGYSKAWLHHKGRNKHHIEYWYDSANKTQMEMPFVYMVEMACDMLSATKVYNGKDYDQTKLVEYWKKIRVKKFIGTKTRIFFDTIYYELSLYGEKYILKKKYMKKIYKDVFEENLNPYADKFDLIEN